jgi:hypothetical protein
MLTAKEIKALASGADVSSGGVLNPFPVTIPASRGLDTNPKALQHELIRHLENDNTMSSFGFRVEPLDPLSVTYWGKRYDADFWIENASVVWKETEAQFHTVARLTLLPKSQVSESESRAIYFDVTGHSSLDSQPVGSINRARASGEGASRQPRMRAYGRLAPESPLAETITPSGLNASPAAKNTVWVCRYIAT